MALFLLVTLAVISPATLHNRLSGGRWVLVSDNMTQNWRVGNSYDSTGGYWNPEKELMPVFSKNFFRLQAKKLGMLLSDYEEPNNVNFYHFRRYNRLLQLPLLSWGFFLAFGLAGMALSRRSRRQLFPLYGYLVFYGLSLAAFFITSRFRLPLYPVMIIFSGHAFAWAVGKLRRQRWAKAASVLIVSSAIWAVMAATSKKTIQAQYFDNMVLLYERLGDVGGAIDELRAKLRWYPDDAAAALRLAYYLHGEARSAEALEVMESFLAAHAEEARILRATGLLEWELGHRDRAVEYLGRYLAARPNAPDSAEVDSLINFQKKR